MRLLHQLARLWGVQTVYYDVFHHQQRASKDALLAILQALGAPISTPRHIPSAYRDRQQALWQRPIEPVIVAWEGKLPVIELRLPSKFIVNC